MRGQPLRCFPICTGKRLTVERIIYYIYDYLFMIIIFIYVFIIYLFIIYDYYFWSFTTGPIDDPPFLKKDLKNVFFVFLS